jgi:hypothetical protein
VIFDSFRKIFLTDFKRNGEGCKRESLSISAYFSPVLTAHLKTRSRAGQERGYG